MTPIEENLLPDRGRLPYLRPKNSTKLECVKNGAKSGFFYHFHCVAHPKKHKVTEEEKIYRCGKPKKLEVLRWNLGQ